MKNQQTKETESYSFCDYVHNFEHSDFGKLLVMRGCLCTAAEDPFAFVALKAADVARVFGVNDLHDLLPKDDKSGGVSYFDDSVFYCDVNAETIEFVDLHGLWALVACGEFKDKGWAADFATWVFGNVAADVFRDEAKQLENIASKFTQSFCHRQSRIDDERLASVNRDVCYLAEQFEDATEEDTYNINLNIKDNEKEN